MLHRHSGPYADLSVAQRDAIVALTLDRYVDEIQLPQYLAEVLGLPPDTPAHAQALGERVALIEEGLRRFDEHTAITAILHQGPGGGWTALAAMRTVRGHRAVPVARSIGDGASSLPTHALLQGFAYPALPGFDAGRTPESQLFEATRLVVARPGWGAALVARGEIEAEPLNAVMSCALAELMAGSIRLARRLAAPERMAAWIFNVKPRLAVTLRDTLGLPLVPLYTRGAEPTPAAAVSPLDGPYLHRWRRELCRDLPAPVQRDVEREGVAAAVRHLAVQDLAAWRDRAVTLPFLVLNDAAVEAAYRRFLALLAQQPYRMAEPRHQQEADSAHV